MCSIDLNYELPLIDVTRLRAGDHGLWIGIATVWFELSCDSAQLIFLTRGREKKMTPPQQGSDAVNLKEKGEKKEESMSYPEPCTGTTVTTDLRSGFRSVHRLSANNTSIC